MPSTKDYLDYILEQLSDLKGLSFRKMMGEFVLYYQNKVVGGIYDDRLLLKPTQSALQILNDSGIQLDRAIPYDGAKEMLSADVDDRDVTCRLIRAIAADLPEPREKLKRKGVVRPEC